MSLMRALLQLVSQRQVLRVLLVSLQRALLLCRQKLAFLLGRHHRCRPKIFLPVTD